MTNNIKFDLEERTTIFSQKVVQLCKKIKMDTINKPIISQLIRACTSIAANYCEADDAESKKDFVHKIGICRKESRETKYWLRIIVETDPDLKDSVRPLWVEAKELNLIFSAIVNSSKNK